MKKHFFIPVMFNNSGSSEKLLLHFPFTNNGKDVKEGLEFTLPYGSIFTDNGVFLNGVTNTQYAAVSELAGSNAINIIGNPGNTIKIELKLTLSSWQTTGWQGAIDCGFSQSEGVRETLITGFANVLGPYYSSNPKQIIDNNTHLVSAIYQGDQTTLFIDDVEVDRIQGTPLSDNLNLISYIGINSGLGNFYYKDLKIIKL